MKKRLFLDYWISCFNCLLSRGMSRTRQRIKKSRIFFPVETSFLWEIAVLSPAINECRQQSYCYQLVAMVPEENWPGDSILLLLQISLVHFKWLIFISAGGAILSRLYCLLSIFIRDVLIVDTMSQECTV
jgi:hypothetical protein